MRRIVDFFSRGAPLATDAVSDGHPEPPAKESRGLDAPISLGPGEFDPDHPISRGYKEDRLGFRSVANMLASSLLTRATNHGLVVSIEGVWGSGKSSLVNLLEYELESKQDHAPEIVRFAPWMVGDRDGMLVELMSDLASAVEAIEAPEAGQSDALKTETKRLARMLRSYGSTLSRQFVPIARLIGLAGIPGAELAAKMLATTSEVLDSLDPGRPVSEVKRELTNGLSKLNRRIVVIVDDLDRLEPQEAAEITRLIRAVADFPNVIYVLCYDPKILASNLKRAVSVDDGAAFLKKIVQVTFKVPLPEAFDLRRWLLDECVIFYESASGRVLLDDERQRLHWICDIEGGLLKTPRDVVRSVNSIKLYWPPIADNVDYADVVWLQMVRLQNEKTL